MSKAGIWPREKPRPTKSEAELKVYSAFASDMPSNWTVWHSLSVRTEDGMEGEGDFVIAIPDRGFLVLEVKGGFVEQRDGLWYQNSKPMERAPRDQAQSFARKLCERLPQLNGITVPFAILTIFPDTPSSETPSQDNLRDQILTEVDVRYLKDAITAKLDKVFRDDLIVPACNWIGKLHELWGETWIPKVSLGHKKECNADERYQLDQQQIAIIDSMSGNERFCIEGVAGSGKTLMAREAAIRMAAQGSKVHLFCYTNALAQWLGASLQEHNVQVLTVPRYAADLMIEQGHIKGIPNDNDFWDDISFRAASAWRNRAAKCLPLPVVAAARTFAPRPTLFLS